MNWDKLPRARLYVSGSALAKALAKLPFVRLERGERARKAEAALAEYFGVRSALTLSSCRIAFHFLLQALDLREGDEVLMAPLTIPDMVNAAYTLGLKPVFLDMAFDTQNLDVEEIGRRAGPRSRVLLVTHLSGLVPDMDRIMEEARRHRLVVVEDVSQCQGAAFQGRKLGTFGVAAVATAGIAKTLGSLYGGFVLTDDSGLAGKVRGLCERRLKAPSRAFLLRHILYNVQVLAATQRLIFSFGTYYAFRLLAAASPKIFSMLQEGPPGRKHFWENPLVLRDRMPEEAMTEFTDLQAEVLIDSLRGLERSNRRRVELAQRLLSLLSGRVRDLVAAGSADGRLNTYWHFPVVVPHARRVEFQRYLLKNGIDSTGYALALCSKEPAFSRFAAETPRAEKIKEGTVFLPIHDSFSERQIDHMAKIVTAYFGP